MAYIGSIPAYQASGVRPRDEFTADGTQICFPLSQSVPGSFESGVTIVLDNVPQQPVEAFTVIDTRTLTLTSITGTFTVNETVTGATSTATGTVIKVNLGSIVIRPLTGTFSSSESITGGSSTATATTTNVSINTGSGILFSEIPTSGSVIYVVHEGNATYNLVPAAASVSATQLADNLRNFTVDTFTGDGTTTAFTLTDTPASANALLVMVDGIVQTRTTNYTLATNVVTFTGAPDSGSSITIIHLGFSTISRTGLVDGSVTTAKIADGSITAAKIADGTIIAADVAAGAITPVKLSTGGPVWDTNSQVSIGSSSPMLPGPSPATRGEVSINGSTDSFVAFGIGGVIKGYVGQTSNGLQLDSEGATTITAVTNGAERLRIDSNGNLFLGATSSPSNSTKLLSYATADQSGITINATNASQTNDVVLIRNTRNTSGGSYNALAVYNDGAGAYRFQLTDGGNIGLFGGQIKFPASQNASSDANTLDDYEEGTWTPNVVNNGSTSSWTTKQGSYVKTGGYVTFWFSCDNGTSNGGTGNGALLLTLPFQISTNQTNMSVGSYSRNGTNYPNAIVLTGGNNTVVQLWNMTSGTNQDQSAPSFITGFIVARTF